MRWSWSRRRDTFPTIPCSGFHRRRSNWTRWAQGSPTPKTWRSESCVVRSSFPTDSLSCGTAASRFLNHICGVELTRLVVRQNNNFGSLVSSSPAGLHSDVRRLRQLWKCVSLGFLRLWLRELSGSQQFNWVNEEGLLMSLIPVIMCVVWCCEKNFRRMWKFMQKLIKVKSEYERTWFTGELSSIFL